MRIFLCLLLVVVSAGTYGQALMVVNHPYPGSMVSDYDRPVTSLTEVPPRIAYNVQGHLDKVLGKFSDSLTFDSGQAIDLDRAFETDSVVYAREYVIPAYRLVYRLRYSPVGISLYYIEVELDRYGQLLQINWPREGHDDPGRFRDLASVQDYAVNRARAGEFYADGYQASLDHNRNLDKLCWVFRFPVEGKQNMYRAIDIPWTLLEVVDEHWILETYGN